MNAPVFIAIGSIDYEFDEVIAAEASLDDAKTACKNKPHAEHSETKYDRFRIQEWTIGATKPTRQWLRDVGDGWNPGTEWIESP